MLSIKPPPYAAEVIAEANGSATKIESGIFAKSKSNDDYLKRVTAKLNSMKALVQKQRQAESNDTAQQNEQAQGANYDAAMAQQQQSTETRDAPATAAPATAPAPAAAAPAAVAASAAQTTAEKELSQQIFQTVVKNQLDRPEFKSAVTKMTPDERKHALGRVTHATKAAMGGYYKLLREKNAKLGPGKQTAGLNPKALIDHLTVNVASMLSRPPAAAGVGAIGPGRASGASGMEKAKSAAAQQAALAQQRREQSAAAATAGAGLGTPAYWQRVGEMRGAYLPRIKQTVEYMLRTGVSRARDASASTSERLLHFMTSSLIPMLEQTADRPCAAATFKAGELETLDAKIRQLIAITAGVAAEGGAGARGAAAAADDDDDGSRGRGRDEARARRRRRRRRRRRSEQKGKVRGRRVGEHRRGFGGEAIATEARADAAAAQADGVRPPVRPARRGRPRLSSPDAGVPRGADARGPAERRRTGTGADVRVRGEDGDGGRGGVRLRGRRVRRRRG